MNLEEQYKTGVLEQHDFEQRIENEYDENGILSGSHEIIECNQCGTRTDNGDLDYPEKCSASESFVFEQINHVVGKMLSAMAEGRSDFAWEMFKEFHAEVLKLAYKQKAEESD